MKCPLIPDKNYGPQLERTMATGDCIKEECAWWHAQNNVCAVLTLAQAGVYLHKALLQMDSKIPLGGKG